MSRSKIYVKNNQVVLSFNGAKRLYYGTEGDLRASSKNNKVTISDTSSQKILFSGDYRNLGREDGTQFNSSASATASSLNVIFDAVNPSNYADKTDLDEIRALIRSTGSGKGVRFDVNDDQSARFEVFQDVAAVSTRKTKVSVDDSSGPGEALISVGANTNNTAEAVDAIRVNGNAGNATSSVEILGTLRVNEKDGRFVVDNTASPSVSFNAGGAEDLSLSSTDTTYDNRLINGSVIVSNTEISIRGLSTGDGVRVSAVFNVDCQAGVTITLDPRSGTFANASVSDLTAGNRDVSLQSVCTAHAGGATFSYDIDTLVQGSYKLKTLEVTIS